MKLKILIILLYLLIPLSVFAAQDIYQFQNHNQELQFRQVTEKLRCLVCQNQNLSESNADLANDLRNQIRIQILQGKTNEQIINFLVSRYGNYILYEPPRDPLGLVLWLAPFILLLLGLTFLFRIIRKVKACSL